MDRLTFAARKIGDWVRYLLITLMEGVGLGLTPPHIHAVDVEIPRPGVHTLPPSAAARPAAGNLGQWQPAAAYQLAPRPQHTTPARPPIIPEEGWDDGVLLAALDALSPPGARKRAYELSVHPHSLGRVRRRMIRASADLHKLYQSLPNHHPMSGPIGALFRSAGAAARGCTERRLPNRAARAAAVASELDRMARLWAELSAARPNPPAAPSTPALSSSADNTPARAAKPADPPAVKPAPICKRAGCDWPPAGARICERCGECEAHGPGDNGHEGCDVCPICLQDDWSPPGPCLGCRECPGCQSPEDSGCDTCAARYGVEPQHKPADRSPSSALELATCKHCGLIGGAIAESGGCIACELRAARAARAAEGHERNRAAATRRRDQHDRRLAGRAARRAARAALRRRAAAHKPADHPLSWYPPVPPVMIERGYVRRVSRWGGLLFDSTLAEWRYIPPRRILGLHWYHRERAAEQAAFDAADSGNAGDIPAYAMPTLPPPPPAAPGSTALICLTCAGDVMGGGCTCTCGCPRCFGSNCGMYCEYVAALQLGDDHPGLTSGSCDCTLPDGSDRVGCPLCGAGTFADSDDCPHGLEYVRYLLGLSS